MLSILIISIRHQPVFYPLEPKQKLWKNRILSMQAYSKFELFPNFE